MADVLTRIEAKLSSFVLVFAEVKRQNVAQPCTSTLARRFRHGHFESLVLCWLCEPIFWNYLAGIFWDRVLRWMFVVWNDCSEDCPVARIRQVAGGERNAQVGPDRPFDILMRLEAVNKRPQMMFG